MAAQVLLRRRTGDRGLKSLVSDIGDIDARDVSSFPMAWTDIVVRVGRLTAPTWNATGSG